MSYAERKVEGANLAELLVLAERSRAKVQTKLQNFNAKIEVIGCLPPRALQILDSLGAGNSQRKTAKIADCCESNVSYWKNRLIAMGALRLQCRSESAMFSLTPIGSKILTGSEGAPREAVGVEDYAVKFVVLRSERCLADGRSCIDWQKLGDPRNWEKLGVKIGDVRVVRTPRHIIIHPGKVRGFDITEVKIRIGRIIEETKLILENNYGMLLSEDYVELHEPIYEFYSREARELSEHGCFNLKDANGKTIGSINRSPPSREGHEEYPEEIAKKRLAMPLTLDDVERKIDVLLDTTERLANSVGKISDALNRLFNLEGNGSAEAPKGSGGKDYVS